MKTYKCAQMHTHNYKEMKQKIVRSVVKPPPKKLTMAIIIDDQSLVQLIAEPVPAGTLILLPNLLLL